MQRGKKPLQRCPSVSHLLQATSDEPVAAQHDVLARPSRCISRQEYCSTAVTDFALLSFEAKAVGAYENSST